MVLFSIVNWIDPVEKTIELVSSDDESDGESDEDDEENEEEQATSQANSQSMASASKQSEQGKSSDIFSPHI